MVRRVAFGLTIAAALLCGALAAYAQDFKPARKLPGSRKTLSDTGASFVMPKGWRGEAHPEMYGMVPVRGANSGQAGLFLTTEAIEQDVQNAPIGDVLQAAASEIMKMFDEDGYSLTQLSWDIEEQAAYAGGSIGRLYLRAQAPAGVLDMYVGLSRTKGYLSAVFGLWPEQAKAEATAAADTVLATLKVRPPKVNQALMSRMAGCWKSYSGSTGSTGNDSTHRTYRFDPSGAYSYDYVMYISMAGASARDTDSEQGAWRVVGNSLLLQPNEGESRRVQVSMQDQLLVLRGNRYVPCN